MMGLDSQVFPVLYCSSQNNQESTLRKELLQVYQSHIAKKKQNFLMVYRQSILGTGLSRVANLKLEK